MTKYLLPLLFLSTIISCSKESSFKHIVPMDVSIEENKISETHTKEETFDPFLDFSRLEIHAISSSIKILSPNEEVQKIIPIKIIKKSFVRSKILNLVKNSNDESLNIEDLFKFEFNIPESELFSLIDHYSFEDLRNIKGIVNINGFLYSEKDGIFEELSYSSGVRSLSETYNDMNLENEADQTNGFQFGLKPSESYEFKLQELNLISMFKKIGTQKSIVFSLDDFKIDNKLLSDWKREVMDKGSILIISNKKSEKYLFIPNLKTVEEVLIENDFDLSSMKKYRRINFTKFSETIKNGDIVSLAEVDNEIQNESDVFIEYEKVQSLKFEKIKNKDVHFFIQFEGIQHVLTHWYQSQRVSHFFNNMYVSSRNCNVSRRRVDSSKIIINPIADNLNYTFSYNGRKKTMDSLIEEGFVRIEKNKKSQHIIIENLPGLSDKAEVLFEIESNLSEVNVIQDKGQCVLNYHSRMENLPGGDVRFTDEDRFDSFKPSTSRGIIGVERFMNVMTVL